MSTAFLITWTQLYQSSESYCFSLNVFPARVSVSFFESVSNRITWPNTCLIAFAATGNLPVLPQHTRVVAFAVRPSVHLINFRCIFSRGSFEILFIEVLASQ